MLFIHMMFYGRTLCKIIILKIDIYIIIGLYRIFQSETGRFILMTKTAVIIGAGPAGLTAAYELLKQTDIHPIILERTIW